MFYVPLQSAKISVEDAMFLMCGRDSGFKHFFKFLFNMLTQYVSKFIKKCAMLFIIRKL